jgi:uncharacterized protein YycO
MRTTAYTILRIFLGLCVLIALLALALGVMESRELRTEARSAYALPEEALSRIQPGDIIMRRGYGVLSNMIATRINTENGLTHCGIVVRYKGDLHVVHTLSSSVSDRDGVQMHALPAFIRSSHPGSIAVSRIRFEEAREALIDGAWQYLRARAPFDHSFDLFDDTSLYCSELIWRCLKDRAGIDIYEGLYDQAHAWYSFDAFFNPALFDPVSVNTE